MAGNGSQAAITASSLFWESLGETEIAAIGGLVAALHPPDAPNKADHRDYPPDH